jgi:tripartite-type tricarboxylate transporter receptor subunit TctC
MESCAKPPKRTRLIPTGKPSAHAHGPLNAPIKIHPRAARGGCSPASTLRRRANGNQKLLSWESRSICLLKTYCVLYNSIPMSRRTFGLTRRHFVCDVAATAMPSIAAAYAVPFAHASSYAWPSRDIKIIVPFGPGGSADVIARYLANQLKDSLGQSIIVENRTGAGGTIGTSSVAKAEPDGYTFIAISNTITANETLRPHRSYEMMRDLAPVALLNIAYNVLVVHPSVQASTLADLISLAKSKPGLLNYGSSGAGSVYHIIGEAFRVASGIEVQHIPFKSSDQARTAVIGGSIDYMFDAIPTMVENIRGKQVRALGTTGLKRDPLLPEVPAISETLTGFEGPIWIGLLAPAQTPKPIIDRLNYEINRVLGLQATLDWHAKIGAHPMPMTVSGFTAFLREDIEKQRKWITEAKIQTE